MNIIEFGDCREIMRKWAANGVKAQTCITSPPYYGLRDYGHDGQIGLEKTPEQYIQAMVEVFRCVRDVLADDGTVWLNIGDSYVATGGEYKNGSQGKTSIVGKTSPESVPCHGRVARRKAMEAGGLKQKDLIGIPWMLAFALRADGWYLRQDIIWNKPNPMPESIKDRCTKAHEYIFLLSKNKSYYYDYMAISESATYAEQHANKKTSWGNKKKEAGVKGNLDQYKQIGIENNKTCLEGGMKNKRSVWSVNVKPYSGAHFAVFPQELIEPCVLAGASQGSIVLDPFMGSGTTAQVAQKLGRQFIGCELNPEYKPLQESRLAQQCLSL